MTGERRLGYSERDAEEVGRSVYDRVSLFMDYAALWGEGALLLEAREGTFHLPRTTFAREEIGRRFETTKTRKSTVSECHYGEGRMK